MKDHPFRYFIAAGESLQAIQRFVEEEKSPRDHGKAFEDFQERYGATDRLIVAGDELALVFDRPPAAGWLLSHENYYLPDGSTDRGRKIQDEMHDMMAIGNAQKRFAIWLRAYELDTDPGPASATFEPFADRFFISVPVVSHGDGKDWAQPPGAIAIPVSEYFRLQEQNGNLTLEPTRKPASSSQTAKPADPKPK